MSWWGKQPLRPGEMEEIKGKIVKIHDVVKCFFLFDITIFFNCDVISANALENKLVSSCASLRHEVDSLKGIWPQGKYFTSRMRECCDVMLRMIENTRKMGESSQNINLDEVEDLQRYAMINRELGPRIDKLLDESFEFANKEFGLGLSREN